MSARRTDVQPRASLSARGPQLGCPTVHVLLALTGVALLAACSPGIGDFCFEDSDCKAGLRCSSQNGERGVCTYPEGAADLALKPDRGRDLAAPDVGVETGPDRGVEAGADQGADQSPDLPLPDQTLPDQALPDQGAPDQGAPDAPPPDTAPDQALSDGSSG